MLNIIGGLLVSFGGKHQRACALSLFLPNREIDGEDGKEGNHGDGGDGDGDGDDGRCLIVSRTTSQRPCCSQRSRKSANPSSTPSGGPRMINE